MTLADVKAMSQEEVNENWAEVSKVLKSDGEDSKLQVAKDAAFLDGFSQGMRSNNVQKGATND